MRLLSVDDDPDILKGIQATATELGFEVETVSHGSVFMKAFVRFKPDIITLDMLMPEMDGIELLRWLGDVECKARVIVISGGDRLYLRMAETLNEVYHKLNLVRLDKPFRLSELRARLIGS